MADDRTPAVLKMAAHRRLFQRAIRENISMEEARRREAAERWGLVDAQLARRRAAATDDQEARPDQPWMMRD